MVLLDPARAHIAAQCRRFDRVRDMWRDLTQDHIARGNDPEANDRVKGFTRVFIDELRAHLAAVRAFDHRPGVREHCAYAQRILNGAESFLWFFENAADPIREMREELAARTIN